MKSKWFLACMAASSVILLAAFINDVSLDTGFELKRQEISLRKIGHEILLRSGDSTSRVLPVKKISDNEYQLQFERPFTFDPDSLVTISRRALAQNKLAADYVVNVLSCTQGVVVFGYTVSGRKNNTVVPCSGRLQPKNCYFINISFKNTAFNTPGEGYLLAGVPLLAFVGLLFFKRTPVPVPAPHAQEGELVRIGSSLFCPKDNHIVFNGVMTGLTGKETEVLGVLAANPNTLTDRNRLQRIWEDEGVIVSRSLDVFVSKLRKKLSADPALRIVNVRGKGFMLEVVPPGTADSVTS